MGLLIGIGQTRPQTPYDYFYGIEWDVSVSNPKPTRIGKMELHASLPVQSLMRRCVLRDNGEVAYYLNANDSTQKEDSTEARLDGEDGQVMVEIPTCYVKFEADGDKRRFLMSIYELPGFHKWERCFVSAYEATIQRSTNRLASVVNATPDYRGGNNNSSRDGTYLSLLGRPASSFTLNQARTFARNRGSSSWNCHTYHVQKVLFWFFAVEYCNFNSQDDFNSSLDDSGNRQGGLGMGITNFAHVVRFGRFPPVPCGQTNSLGNKSGVVEYSCPCSDDGSLAAQTLQVNSYRGVENPFGHIWKMADGAKAIVKSASSGDVSEFYVCDNKENWSERGVENYEFRGRLARANGYIKELILGDFGEIMPSKVGAGTTTYFCDYFYSSVPTRGEEERLIAFGNLANEGANAGIVSSNVFISNSYASQFVGTRLCYIP